MMWHPDRDPTRTVILFMDRETSEGFASIPGDEVEDVGASSFTARGSTIPFYKVLRVLHNSEVLFERKAPDDRG